MIQAECKGEAQGAPTGPVDDRRSERRADLRNRTTYRHLIGSAVPLLLVAGCGPSVEGYVDDTEARREILAQCAKLELDPRDDERCAMATEAEAIAAKRAVEGMFDGD